ncbi:MAG TPA: CpsB/CapC family capsule biosynthesis tyrosine phosphatase [Thermoanaerobaculia bacterium]|nr:CpsB/CapC family capsule biosynthesis tyrosine phosphatase [Thermoanaerobaculia bacterium]
MIDIHHHCLPGVDDGPRDLAEAADLCAMAAAEGIETIVATPHVLRERWPTFSREELQAKFDELVARVGDTPRLLLGSEYFFSHDMAELLQEGKTILPLAGSRYVLLELAANSVPPLIEQPFYRAQLAGWTPIIAHPERNVVLQSRPDVLAYLIGHGARTQLTATSLTGAFGSAARKAAETFLRLQLVHFVATDAHNTSKRPPVMGDALNALRSLVGESVTEALTVENPRAVVENRPLPWDPEPQEEATGGFFTRVKSFFGRGQA